MEFINRNPKIFILSGKARSGKNVVADLIEEYYKNKKCIQLSYAYYLKQYVKKISTWDGSEETKPRKLLQEIGIELIKNKINDKLLIRRVCEDIKVYSYFFDVIIITDARLVDEVEIINQNFNNVTTIRINRDNFDNNLTNDEKLHLTEVALDSYNNFDYVINNSENIENEINKILKEIDYGSSN